MKSYETENLIIRTFEPKDWRGVQSLAIDRQQSPTSHYDHPWPTSEKDCKAIATEFARREDFWAVCVKQDGELIGIVTINSVDMEKCLDLGHLFHSERASIEMAKEAIQRMVQYVFDEMLVEKVTTHNAAAWRQQIEPLEALGFRKTKEEMGRFVDDSLGESVRFTAITHEMTRQEWYEHQGIEDA